MITALGTIFIAGSSGRIMLGLRSSDSKHGGQWGFFGGKQEEGESDFGFGETLGREVIEEIGGVPGFQKIFPLDEFTSPDGRFRYVSYITLVREEFVPQLNREHKAYCWALNGCFPRPLHRGAERILISDEASANKIKYVIDNFCQVN